MLLCYDMVLRCILQLVGNSIKTIFESGVLSEETLYYMSLKFAQCNKWCLTVSVLNDNGGTVMEQVDLFRQVAIQHYMLRS